MTRRQIAAILFDKDGTLVDFEATWAPVNRAAVAFAADGDAAIAARIAQACGLDMATGRTRAESPFAIAGASEIAAAMRDAGSRRDQAGLTRELHRLFHAGAGTAMPIGDVAGVLRALKGRGLALGVASSDCADAVTATVATLGLDDLVIFTCGYDSGHGTKPSPGMVDAFAAAAGVAPAAIAVVGDSTHDLAMARNAGAGHAIGVLSGTGTAATLAQLADVLLPSVADLPAWLDGLARQRDGEL